MRRPPVCKAELISIPYVDKITGDVIILRAAVICVHGAGYEADHRIADKGGVYLISRCWKR